MDTQNNISPVQRDQLKELIMGLYQCCQQRMQYQCDRFGLPDAELRCLMLFVGERYLTPKWIAQRMNVAKSRVTRILDGLEKRGFIKRTPDPEDSRVTLVSLTPAGKDKLDEVNDFLDSMHALVLESFPLEQRQTLLSTLSSLKGAMQAARDMLD